MAERPVVKLAQQDVFDKDIQAIIKQLHKIGGYPLNDQEDARFIAQLALKSTGYNDKQTTLRMVELSSWACYYVQQACLIVVASKLIKGVLDDYYATFGNDASIETRPAVLVQVAEDSRSTDALTKMASILFAKLAAEFGAATSTRELKRINLVSGSLLGVTLNAPSWNWDSTVFGGDDRYREPETPMGFICFSIAR